MSSPVLVFGDPAAIFEHPKTVDVTRIARTDEVQQALGREDALVIAAAEAMIAMAPDIVRAVDARRAALLVVGEKKHEAVLFAAFQTVQVVLAAPVSEAAFSRAAQHARDVVGRRGSLERIQGQLARRNSELSTLNKIGTALSAERDIHRLLSLILEQSRAITKADAGSLYLVERGGNAGDPRTLRFTLARNDSVSVPFEEFRMPLDETSIAGHVAVRGQPVNIDDAYELAPGTPYKISRSFDQRSGYRTKSMLVVPMRDHQENVIGVIQLINKKRDASAILAPSSLVDRYVIPFDELDMELMMSLASQAAVALLNTRLIEDIRTLFNSFVDASVTAIESRDPTTSGHSGRVADLTVGLMQKVDSASSGLFASVRYTRDQIQEARYASLLHDFGKVGVREKVLVKAKKLYFGEMLAVRQRFGVIKRTAEVESLKLQIAALKGGASETALQKLEQEHAEHQARIDHMLELIARSNEPTVLDGEAVDALLDIPKQSYCDIDGVTRPYLTPNEVQALSIRRGSLSEEERREIESHVTHTYRFLSQIPWTGEFARIPEIAFAHHEKLDGTGYPRRLRGAEIPLQSRMMTIADIFDALVAWDRPYKKAVPVEKALSILHDEASHGKLDADLLKVFVDARVFDLTVRAA